MREQEVGKLIARYNCKIGYEIGVSGGHTYRHILDTCKKLKEWHGVDIWEPSEGYEVRPNGVEWDHEGNYKKVVKIAEQYKDKAFIHRMTSEEASKEVEDESIDIVFIDADHSYEGVKNDIIYWAPKVKSGGVICGHDYGLDRFPGVKKAVLEFFDEELIQVESDNVWWIEKA